MTVEASIIQKGKKIVDNLSAQDRHLVLFVINDAFANGTRIGYEDGFKNGFQDGLGEGINKTLRENGIKEQI